MRMPKSDVSRPGGRNFCVTNLWPVLLGFSLLVRAPLALAANNGMQDQIPPGEYSALLDLYNSTSGTGWTTKAGWNNGAATTWYGVTVTGATFDGSGNVTKTGNVTAINLSVDNLVGTIPASIGNFPRLQELELFNNDLSGGIPTNVANLTQLEDLILFDNQLTGGIPAGLGNLAQLQEIDLHNNQFSGSIPAALGGLSGLQDLELDGNSLTGGIPGALGNLSQLQILYLYGNQLSGSIPNNIGSLANLTVLDFSDNDLTGNIPATFGSLSQLVSLDLGANALTGSIPPELSALSELEDLQLYYNQLTGTVPAGLGALSQMREIDLDQNQIDGSIPANLDSLSQLQYLDLSYNQLTGEVPNLSNIAGGSYVNLVDNCLDFSPGSLSLMDIHLMNSAGINPNYSPQNPGCNPTPTPALQGPAQVGEAMELTWNTLPGLIYQLQSTTDLTRAWTNCGGQFAATNFTTTVPEPTTNGVQKFYRIIELP